MNVDGCLALFSRSVCLIAAHVTPRQTHPASVMYFLTLCAPYSNAVREVKIGDLFLSHPFCGSAQVWRGKAFVNSGKYIKS